MVAIQSIVPATRFHADPNDGDHDGHDDLNDDHDGGHGGHGGHGDHGDIDDDDDPNDGQVRTAPHRATQLTRAAPSNVVPLADKSIWRLDGAFEAMRLARDRRYDGTDQGSGHLMQGFVQDPPEPDRPPIVAPRRYAFQESRRRAPGEQVAAIPQPDVRIAGRGLDEVGSTRPVTQTNYQLGAARTASKLLTPVALFADDVTPSHVLGEVGGAHGAFGDASFRDSFDKGGLHPKHNRVTKTYGVDNTPANAVDYGQAAADNHHARMLGDVARTPQLRQTTKALDQVDPATVVGGASRGPQAKADVFRIETPIPVRMAGDAQPGRSSRTEARPLPGYVQPREMAASPYAASPHRDHTLDPYSHAAAEAVEPKALKQPDFRTGTFDAEPMYDARAVPTAVAPKHLKQSEFAGPHRQQTHGHAARSLPGEMRFRERIASPLAAVPEVENEMYLGLGHERHHAVTAQVRARVQGEASTAPLRSELAPQNDTFRIVAGTLPTTRERSVVATQPLVAEQHRNVNLAAVPGERMRQPHRSDLRAVAPEHGEVPRSEAAAHGAPRRDVDRTRLVPRLDEVDVGYHDADPLERNPRPSIHPKPEMPGVLVGDYQAAPQTLVAVEEPSLPDPRIGPGKGRVTERASQSTQLMYADTTVSGLQLDTAARLGEDARPVVDRTRHVTVHANGISTATESKPLVSAVPDRVGQSESLLAPMPSGNRQDAMSGAFRGKERGAGRDDGRGELVQSLPRGMVLPAGAVISQRPAAPGTEKYA